MKISISFILFLVMLSAQAQNVGIGTNTPTRAGLVVAQKAGETYALFGAGSNSTSLTGSILNNNAYLSPTIGFNMYHNNGDKRLVFAHAGKILYDQIEGDFHFFSSDAGPADETITNYSRPMSLYRNGYLFLNRSPGDPFLGGLNVNVRNGGNFAVFGSNTTGVSIQGPQPAIGFNSHLGNDQRVIANGYAGFAGLNTTTGDFYIQSSSSFRFSGDLTNATMRLLINKDGDVGIGTATPKAKLHLVADDFNAEFLRFENKRAPGNGVSSQLEFITGNQVAGSILVSATDAFNHRMGFYTYGGDANGTGGSERLSISSNGLVGIANINPTLAGLVGDRKVGAVNALFGSSTTGVAIETDYPGIGFNTYFNNGRKFIANGYGGLVGLNPVNGDFYILNTVASGSGGTTANASTRLLITRTGNVGINTSTPQERLTVKGNGTGIAQESSNGLVKVALRADDAGGTWVGAISNSDLRITAGLGVNAIFAQGGTGLVGIGTTTPGVRFQVGNSGDGTIARANAWQTFSDERFKKDIMPIADALEKLESLHGYYYYWKEGDDTRRQAGLMAQEVERVLPEIVSTDGDGYKSVDYGKINALLLQALKEQRKNFDTLKAEVDQLKKMLKKTNDLSTFE